MRHALMGLALAVFVLAVSAQGLTILSPENPRSTTLRHFVNVLGRTAPGSTARIEGVAVPVYATGVFVRDRVPLTLGMNAVTVEVTSPSGEVNSARIEVERTTPLPPTPLPIDRLAMVAASILPQAVRIVREDEPVEVSFTATPGQRAEARLGGHAWQPMAEYRPGQYSARLFYVGNDDTAAAPVQVRLTALRGQRFNGPRVLTAASPGAAGLWHSRRLHLMSTGSEGANLTYGVHEVRLGGPNLTELPSGVLLRVTGRNGGAYRVVLAADTEAWVPVDGVIDAPPGTVQPSPVITTMSVMGNAAGDVVNIPWPAVMPYALRVATSPEGRQRLELDLFGSHHATTWITHAASARLVRELSVEQPAAGRVRVRIDTHSGQLWGWRVEREGGALLITLRAPPLAATGVSPLTGMLIALEPGHGGSANLGAVGATRVPEKDINRWTVEALKAELENIGARVLVVREGDDDPNLRERARRVSESGADLFVSVHANSTDTGNGYLRAAGTSVYYKHATGRNLAAAVHKRLLEQTGLPDFGRVGNFNYAPTRLVTWMPAVLVEQAFVSNPAEEAMLLDPAFRARMARAVRLGLEDFVSAR